MRLRVNLRYLLNKNDLTAAQISRLLKIPNATLSDWLNGSSPKNLLHLKRIANHFSITIDDLIFSDLEKFNTSDENKIIEKYNSEIIAGEFLVILKPIKK